MKTLYVMLAGWSIMLLAACIEIPTEFRVDADGLECVSPPPIIPADSVTWEMGCPFRYEVRDSATGNVVDTVLFIPGVIP